MLLKLACISPVCWVHLFYFICQSPALNLFLGETEDSLHPGKERACPSCVWLLSFPGWNWRFVTPRKRESVPNLCLTSLFSWVKVKIRYTQENRERAQYVIGYKSSKFGMYRPCPLSTSFLFIFANFLQRERYWGSKSPAICAQKLFLLQYWEKLIKKMY